MIRFLFPNRRKECYVGQYMLVSFEGQTPKRLDTCLDTSIGSRPDIDGAFYAIL